MSEYWTYSRTLRLTPHFSIDELFRSATAIRLGIENLPETKEEYDRVVRAAGALAKSCLEPLRLLAGEPVIVNSWYRCPQLNAVIGGSLNSQHLFGEAADIHCNGKTVEELFLLVKESDVPFDQLIWERRMIARGGKAEWLHVSHSPDGAQRLMAMHSFSAGSYVSV